MYRVVKDTNLVDFAYHIERIIRKIEKVNLGEPICTGQRKLEKANEMQSGWERES